MAKAKEMNLLKIIAGTIFNLLGAVVLIKGVRVSMSKGAGEGFVDMITGLGFIIIGLLVWNGYIG